MTKSASRPAGGHPDDPGNLSLPWLLRRTNQHYRNAIREGLATAGFGDVAQAGFWALDAVAGGAGDARQLGAEMGVTKQAVSKIVEALVAGGYLERRTNDLDRRRSDLALTARGEQAARAVRRAVTLTDREFERTLGASGVRRLRGLLVRLAAPG